MVHVIKNNLKKYPIFFGIIFLTLILRELYPFSRYPMYDHFPNWSYTFYFEDEKGETCNNLPVSHAGLSHLFYTECQNQKISYGYGEETAEQLQSIGTKLIQQIFVADASKINGASKITLFRIHNYTKHGVVISDTTKIATSYVE